MNGNANSMDGNEKALFEATLPFATECRWTSWWHVASTFLLLASSMFFAASLSWWPAQLAFAILGGLLFVRAFILFHDFMHGSLLHGSSLANLLFSCFGFAVLTPPQSWRRGHNVHHAHVGKPVLGKNRPAPLVTSEIGSFPLMSTEVYRHATFRQRIAYRIARHPLTILAAYGTVFFFNICLLPFVRFPRRHWDGGVSIVVHAALITLLAVLGGPSVVFFGFLLPLAIGAVLGAYLFYAQHNFPEMRVVPAGDWNYSRGSMESSSFMKLGPIMNWFTGNIGYHHIHHLNSRIVFYRLPEAMAAIPQFQNPLQTTLHPRDISACFRSNLWDARQQRLVSYREAANSQPGTATTSEPTGNVLPVGPTLLDRNAAVTLVVEH